VVIGFTSCEGSRIEKLKREGIMRKAKITDCNGGSKGIGVIVDYTFMVSGKMFKGKQSYYEMKSSVCSELFYQEVSIIYVEEEPDVNRLMISKHDFEKLKYPYPDSLKWTEQYYK
ncbi:MAG TPA: hypothetical protein VK173_07760, partial [Lacibacter sp.]|nr:hypothetical protein [Lacibacter sp.]